VSPTLVDADTVTRMGTGPAKSAPKRAKKTHDMIRACTLRAEGASLDQVAEQMDIDKSWAWRLITDALAQLPTEPAEQVRQLLLLRLDKLYAAHAGAALAGDVKALDAVLKVIDRQIKLHRLDDDLVTAAPSPEGPRHSLRDLVGGDQQRAMSLARALHEHLSPANGQIIDPDTS
jgi:hypothetical protein